MRVVIALGGNALLRRGEPLSYDNQVANVALACARIAAVVPGNEVVVAHGNGPQVGLLSLQQAAYESVAPYPLDVLGAQTEAMIGYLIEQELGNLLPPEQMLATLLTQVEVYADDPAFSRPTKPIGPLYSREEAQRLAAERGWTVAPDGDAFRRVVPSPRPRRIFEIRPIRLLLEAGSVVVCAGGGGVPTMFDAQGTRLSGVEAVIDKDHAAALLAIELDADLLVIATDVDGVYRGWGTPRQQRLDRLDADEVDADAFPAGSMGPKVDAAARFARQTGRPACIGSLNDIADIVAGVVADSPGAGTRVVASTP